MIARVFAAELARVFILLRRYPGELVGKLVWNLAFALIVYFGLSAVGDPLDPAFRFAQLDRLLGLLISYVAINGLTNPSELLTIEARSGTLEQALLGPLPFPLLVLLRDLAAYVEQLLRFALVWAAAQWMTGGAYHLDVAALATLLSLMFLGNEGLGLLLGSVTLLTKRTRTLLDGMTGLVFALTLFPYDGLPGWLKALAHAFPFSEALYLLQAVCVRGHPFTETIQAGRLLPLLGWGTAYLALGLAVMGAAVEHARRAGSLARY